MTFHRSNPAPRVRPGDLDAHYSKIGISAVVAAVRYQGEAKNPAYAPVEPSSDARIADAPA